VRGSVTDASALEGVVAATRNRFGRIDAVVNNTGHAAKGDLLSLSDEEWHAGLDLLLLGPSFCPPMRAISRARVCWWTAGWSGRAEPWR
jgi:NAD(P)-dependent dehydrogenase (short-subunit alcohol dehydrogenase family)